MARVHEFVLPSGVNCKVRSLTGKDQGTITSQDNQGSIKAFNQMLSDCIIQLGDKDLVTPKDVEKMLANDRKFALVELRQFSLRHREEFEFTFDWPIKGGAKDSQEYSITYNDVTFPTVPYSWVKERLKEMDPDELQDLAGSFPKMYDSYQAMMEANLEREFTTEEGQVIIWKIVTGETETKWSNADKKLMDSNMPLKMRDPKIMLVKEEGGDKVKYNWIPENADILDCEDFRKEIREVEGEVDTFLTIQHQTDDSRSTRVDLLATVDFFFPSRAI